MPHLDRSNGGGLEFLGPSEAFLERAKGIYRWDLLIKSKEVRTLQQAVHWVRETCYQKKWPVLVDIDPYGI
jgi:primosomal protein N'